MKSNKINILKWINKKIFKRNISIVHKNTEIDYNDFTILPNSQKSIEITKKMYK